jgi:hypothetical protein
MRDEDGKVVKGYLRAAFVDAWSRYLPDEEEDDSKPGDLDGQAVGGACVCSPEDPLHPLQPLDRRSAAF